MASVVVGLGGCGGDEETAPAPPAQTRPVASAPSATAPPGDDPVIRPGAPAGTTPGQPADGGEERIRTPAEFTFGPGGRVTPPTVTVPAFIAVELTLVSRDGRAHELALSAGRPYRLRVQAGGRTTVRIAGLRAGTYRLMPVGGGPSPTLVVSGEPAGP